ncbi:hypothetical protein [Rhizomonospora bruguierae]|uniref:hypothetical protein n=1 Tax=Rhizomonospora bruguierae TaxID=1581705 RepID=UPI001BCF6B01|nr:hypothetical protein [Micromonospora sp. NBRC 107566]
MTITMTRDAADLAPWRGLRGDAWRERIDVAAFVRDNYTPYEGGPDFLAGPTERTTALWNQLRTMFVEERRRGVYGSPGTR